MQQDFFSSRIPEHSFVAEDAEQAIVGWAAAPPTPSRAAYRGVVEHSVYIDPDEAGCGTGTLLLGDLIDTARANRYWTIQSAIFTDNTASRALPTKAGFREIRQDFGKSADANASP